MHNAQLCWGRELDSGLWGEKALPGLWSGLRPTVSVGAPLSAPGEDSELGHISDVPVLLVGDYFGDKLWRLDLFRTRTKPQIPSQTSSCQSWFA